MQNQGFNHPQPNHEYRLSSRVRRAVVEHGPKAVATIVVYTALCKMRGYRMVKLLEVTPDYICAKTINGTHIHVIMPKS